MNAETMKSLLSRLYSALVLLLAVGEVLLVLVSWLFSATLTDGPRSLLSGEGVRWLLGHFSTLLATPALVWLLLIAMAGGCLWRSGLLRAPATYGERVGRRAVFLFILSYVVVLLALVLPPHAILLSATGRFLPSPLSRAAVPLLALGVLLASTLYGWIAGRFVNIADVTRAMAFGIAQAAPLLVLYVLVVQFGRSLAYVLG